MASHNRKGRTKDAPLPWEQCHVQLINAFRQEPAWKALNAMARLVYIEMKALYNGQNNGRIMASHRFLAERVSCDKSTAARCLDELQAKGFIRPTTRGSLGWSGKGQGTTWRLTELGALGERPTKDYRDWCESRTPPEKSVQAGRKMRAVSGEGARKARAGCPENAGRKGPKSAQPCPHNSGNLVDIPGDRLCGVCRASPLSLPRVFSGQVGSTATMTSTSRVFSTAARRYRGAA